MLVVKQTVQRLGSRSEAEGSSPNRIQVAWLCATSLEIEMPMTQEGFGK